MTSSGFDPKLRCGFDPSATLLTARFGCAAVPSKTEPRVRSGIAGRPIPGKVNGNRIRLGEGVDAIAAIDVDDDGRAEVIAQRGGGETLNLAWLQAQQASARGFEEHAIGEVPAASHDLGAGPCTVADRGRRPAELAVASGIGVFYFPIPDDTAAGPLAAFALRPLTRGSRSPISTVTSCLTLRPLPATQRRSHGGPIRGMALPTGSAATSPMFPTWSIRTAWRSPIWTATDEPTSS